VGDESVGFGPGHKIAQSEKLKRPKRAADRKKLGRTRGEKKRVQNLLHLPGRRRRLTRHVKKSAAPKLEEPVGNPREEAVGNGG